MAPRKKGAGGDATADLLGGGDGGGGTAKKPRKARGAAQAGAAGTEGHAEGSAGVVSSKYPSKRESVPPQARRRTISRCDPLVALTDVILSCRFVGPHSSSCCLQTVRVA
jgi:hypothetical protein